MTVVRKVVLAVFGIVAAVGLTYGSASAQATRTWVSGVGDDANPCSRTAPCKTFAGAISKTAAGGEIDCLDPGGFGAVTITKSITIDCGGVTGGVLASLTNGVIINAGVNDKVILRNISINAPGNGLNGVRVLAGRFVEMDNCSINGFTGHGVSMENAGTTSLTMRDCHITLVSSGVRLAGAGAGVVSLQNVHMSALARGVEVVSTLGKVTVESSVIHQANVAAVVVTTNPGSINVQNSSLTNNGTAANAGVSGATIRLSNNGIFHNGTAFSFVAGATIASADNNVVGGNGGAQLPNVTLTVE